MDMSALSDLQVVAIDGPAGSGKSTIGRALAERLGLEYLDTGAMYRAVAFSVIRSQADPDDTDRVRALARSMDLQMAGGRVLVDGVDATLEIRGPEVTRAVTAVAADPEVRTELCTRQRLWALERGGGVIEGRDIGSVVFPDAVLKVYLTASVEERARRRAQEMQDLDYDRVAQDLVRRDESDSSRAASPLVTADGAVEYDTTGVEVARVVEDLATMVAERT